jgi:hypothetical protein
MIAIIHSFVLRMLCFASMTFFALSVALASPITPTEVEQYFTRYMANGRSNVEMQYTLSESDAFAGGEHTDDRVHMSTISLYEVPEKIVLDGEFLRELGKRWVFIHESQHALILPHLNPRHPGRDASIGVWAQFRLIQQTHENAADARAIIRIWKMDGSEAARALAEAIIPFRDGDGAAHQTQCAIKETIATLSEHYERVASDIDEFQFTLDTAEKCAHETAGRLLAGNVGATRATEIMQSSAVMQTIANIHTALVSIAKDYASGRFQNNAATIRFAKENGKTSARDYHFYVDTSNAITREAVVGGEGARGKQELMQAMSAPSTPERFLAIEAAKKLGVATKDKLNDTEILFTRFVNAFAGASAERRARAFGIIARVIVETDRREQLGALYTEVNRRLMFDLGYPAQ